MQAHKNLERDALALGLTRPPLWMGIPVKIVFPLGFLSMWLFVLTKSLWVIPIAGCFYVITLFFSTKEPRFYEYAIRLFTKTPSLPSKAHWNKTNSYEPW